MMKLLGGYNSPYTRRVAITLHHYALDFELEHVTPFGDQKAMLREVNPVARIPVLILADGELLSDSQVILEYLDSLVPEDQKLTPVDGKLRREVLQITGIASAAVDKFVSVLYEYHFRPPELVYKPWVKMCEQQAGDGFRWLNDKLNDGRFIDHRLTQADISAAVFWQFALDKRPRFCERLQCDALQRLSEELESTPAFEKTEPDGPLPEGLELGLRPES